VPGIPVDEDGICPCYCHTGPQIRGERLELPACPHAVYEDPEQTIPTCMAYEFAGEAKIKPLCEARRVMAKALRMMELADEDLDRAIDEDMAEQGVQ
jgi:hypothetical protein